MDIKGFKGRDGTVHKYDYEALANRPETEATPDQGAVGGYYTPLVTQPSEKILQFDFTPSNPAMPSVKPVTVELPAGPGSGGNVAYDEAQELTDEQKAQARENIGAQPVGNYLTEVPEGYAKKDDIPTDEEIIQLIEEHAPEPSGGGIAVTGATVGQTVKISAVDENGVPTAWESVDFPSGGGSAEWELLEDVEITEETAVIQITNLKPSYTEILCIVNDLIATTNTYAGTVWVNGIQINGGALKTFKDSDSSAYRSNNWCRCVLYGGYCLCYGVTAVGITSSSQGGEVSRGATYIGNFERFEIRSAHSSANFASGKIKIYAR